MLLLCNRITDKGSVPLCSWCCADVYVVALCCVFVAPHVLLFLLFTYSKNLLCIFALYCSYTVFFFFLNKVILISNCWLVSSGIKIKSTGNSWTILILDIKVRDILIEFFVICSFEKGPTLFWLNCLMTSLN